MKNTVIGAGIFGALMCSSSAMAEETPPEPLTNPGTWVRMGDYPASALARGEQGTLSFEVEVDKKGKPVL